MLNPINTQDPDGYIVAVENQVVCQYGTDEPVRLSYQEFAYWQNRIHAIDPNAKVAVLFGVQAMDRWTRNVKRYLVGQRFVGDTRLAFPWNGKTVCGGVGKIGDHKWLPLRLTVVLGPGGHFHHISHAEVVDARTYPTGKKAAEISSRLVEA